MQYQKNYTSEQVKQYTDKGTIFFLKDRCAGGRNLTLYFPGEKTDNAEAESYESFFGLSQERSSQQN